MIDTKAINQAFDQSGLKKNAVAERLNLTVQTLTRKMNGEAEFTVSEAQSLSEIMRLSVAQRQQIFFPGM